MILERCLFVSRSGGARTPVLNEMKEMDGLGLIIFEVKNGHKPRLRIRIEEFLALHDAKTEEIDQVYNHILMEMLE